MGMTSKSGAPLGAPSGCKSPAGAGRSCVRPGRTPGGHAGGVAAGSWLLVTPTCTAEWGTLAAGQPGQVIPAPAPQSVGPLRGLGGRLRGQGYAPPVTALSRHKTCRSASDLFHDTATALDSLHRPGVRTLRTLRELR